MPYAGELSPPDDRQDWTQEKEYTVSAVTGDALLLLQHGLTSSDPVAKGALEGGLSQTPHHGGPLSGRESMSRGMSGMLHGCCMPTRHHEATFPRKNPRNLQIRFFTFLLCTLGLVSSVRGQAEWEECCSKGCQQAQSTQICSVLSYSIDCASVVVNRYISCPTHRP
jgi:hypothetical protein